MPLFTAAHRFRLIFSRPPEWLGECISICADDVPFIARAGRGWLLRPNPWRHVIHVYDATGNVIETHEHKGGFKEYLAITR